MVEAFGQLPTNHFGATKKRSTEQALMLPQESIYKEIGHPYAWRAFTLILLAIST